MSEDIKQCKTCRIYENGTCWKKVIKHQDRNVKETDSCKKYEINPNKSTVAPIKPIILDTANNVPINDKPNDTSNESTAIIKVDK